MSYVAGSELRPGTTVAGYRIETLIGRGGMGAVYRAEEAGLHRKVALKVIAPELGQDARFRERFLRESQIAASLDHPHVIPIYQAGEEEGVLFLAMRYVEGTDLAKLVAEEGALDPRRALDILAQVAEALDAAHEKDLVHRDVKPSNVLITEAAGKEHCYLADFGLTKRTGSLSGVTAAGDIVGTLEYVAPEQITGDPLDERADVYSLGCVLYECLTGQSPFPRATDVALLWAHVHEEPTPPSNARPELPRELDTVLARALAKELGRRYRSAGELVAATRSALGIGETVRAENTVRRRAAQAMVALRARRWALAALAVAVGGAAVATFLIVRGLAPSITVPPNHVGVIDPASNRVVDAVQVGNQPSAVAADSEAVWVANADDQTLSRIDPTTRKQDGPVVSLGATPAGLAVGFGSVWVLDRDVPQLLRVDVDIGRVLKKIPLPLAAGYFPAGVTVGAGSVWAAYDSPGQLVRVDPATGRVVKSIAIGSPTAIAYGAGAVWIGGPYDGVTRIDPSTNTVRHREPLPNTVTGIAVGDGYVWATVGADDVVWQLDTDGNVQRSFETGSGPAGVTVADAAAWIANSRDGTVTRVDPSDPNARTTTGVGNLLAAIVAVPVASGAELWLTVAERPADPLLPPNGARIVMGSDSPSSISPAIASIDPAIAFSPQAYQWEYATAAKLVNYPDEPPPAGLRPQPELAAGPPAVSDGGTVYTFRIRSGFRFSPPSNELVTAATVRDSIERALSPELGPNAPGIRFADVIKGADAYHAGTAAHVAGLRASGDTLTIRLTRPVGDLLHRLALPMFSVVPRRTAVIANGLVKPIPSAGPYYVALYTPGQRLVLRRNPHYTGPRSHALDEFVYTFGQSADQAAGLVKAGQADYTTPGLPPAFPILSPAFAPGGALDRMYGAHGVSKPQRFFLTPTLSIGRLAMNTSRGIFRDARLRRAVNYALERSALAAQLGPLLGGPSDQYLPLGMPGSRETHIYPLTRPNLARAKALARGRGGRAMLWTCNLPGCLARAEIIRRSLAPLGIHVTVNSDFPVGAAIVATSKRGANFDLSPFMSTADLPDPGSFLRSLFDGSLLRATGNTNVSYFNEPIVNARLARADRLSGRARERAFGRIAADLARNQAPIAVFSQPYQAEFVSERLGCLTEQPVFGGLDLAALCLRKKS